MYKGSYQRRFNRYNGGKRWQALLAGALIVLFAVILVAAVAVLIGAIVMVLWNFVMPAVFALPALNLVQAIALAMLCAVLFKTPPTSRRSKD